MGLPAFFVISGFGIANSLLDAKITPKYCGLFALRRSIRIDPPSWFGLLVAVGFGYWFGFISPAHGAPPTFKLVLANLFYLQGLLHYPNLSFVQWTLCLEVQFYVCYLLLLGLAQRLSISVYWPVLALGCFSLFFPARGGYWEQTRFVLFDPYRSVLPIFSMFALGIVLLLHHAKLIPSYLCAFWLGIVCLRVLFWPEPWMLAALAVALIILVGLRWKLVLFENPVALFLGSISYSWYLIHVYVAHGFINLAGKEQGHFVFGSLWSYLWWYLAALGLSILAAWGMSVLIEQPMLRLSKKVVLPRGGQKQAPVPVATGDRRAPAYLVWVIADLLLLAVGLVFVQTLGHNFILHDDDVQVYDNPHVTPGLTLSGVWWALTDGPDGEWTPLSTLSHMLDCQLYGLNPARAPSDQRAAARGVVGAVVPGAAADDLPASDAGHRPKVGRGRSERREGRASGPERNKRSASDAHSGRSERREGRASGPERNIHCALA